MKVFDNLRAPIVLDPLPNVRISCDTRTRNIGEVGPHLPRWLQAARSCAQREEKSCRVQLYKVNDGGHRVNRSVSQSFTFPGSVIPLNVRRRHHSCWSRSVATL
mmetsp:Transcript_47524/g.116449  ORF Transcript_47524/g.116449 Transcript_47524/m.116449 type:complete len:104 (-) Transcript_47524:36-347(-)